MMVALFNERLTMLFEIRHWIFDNGSIPEFDMVVSLFYGMPNRIEYEHDPGGRVTCKRTLHDGRLGKPLIQYV